MAGASAADNETAPALTVNNSTMQQPAETEVNINQSTASSVNISTNDSTDTAENLTPDSSDEQLEAAAGTTKTLSTTTFTLSQIKDAANRVKSYIETSKRLPEYVTIGSSQVQMSDFLKDGGEARVMVVKKFNQQDIGKRKKEE